MEGISTKRQPAQNTANGLDVSSSKAASFSANTQEDCSMRVLLVEDHADTRRAMVRLLEILGYKVCGVSGAQAALSLMATEAFDVVISDIGLKESDGHELMRQIRQFSATPAIALSGHSTAEDLRKSQEAGFSDHLIKPIELATLDSALRRIMVRRSL